MWQHKLSIQHHLILLLHFIINVTDYWPLAREYLILNATVAALQFSTADLEAHILSSTIEHVYNAFFYTTSMHLLCPWSEEVLIGCFVTMLNASFGSKLTLEDEGYESGSENLNMPTPLRCTPQIHHVSSDDNISFDPTIPHSTGTSQSHHKPVWCQLSFSTSDDEDSSTDDIHLPAAHATTEPLGFCTADMLQAHLYHVWWPRNRWRRFQIVPLYDNHWTTEEIPDRHLCIHKHSVPHSLCPYPCPYMDYTSTSYHNMLGLSDISEFEDLMTISSDEDIPGLDDQIGYWNL